MNWRSFTSRLNRTTPAAHTFNDSNQFKVITMDAIAVFVTASKNKFTPSTKPPSHPYSIDARAECHYIHLLIPFVVENNA